MSFVPFNIKHNTEFGFRKIIREFDVVISILIE